MSSKHLGAPEANVVPVVEGSDDDPSPLSWTPGEGLEVLCDDELGGRIGEKAVFDVDPLGLGLDAGRGHER